MFYVRIAIMYTFLKYMIVFFNWTVDLYITLELGLSDRLIKYAKDLKSLNERLPIKMAEKSFKENDSFSIKKMVGSTLELYAKVFFSLDKYLFENMGWKPSFCNSTYRK